MIALCSFGQNNIEISIQQDARLFLLGDKKGNDPLTINILSKVEVPIYSLKKSYFSSYISIEYADLVGKNFKRYAFGAAYIVKKVFSKIGAGVYVDFGKIYRKKVGFTSFSISGELNYKISKHLKFICTQQVTHRKDLKVLYNSKNDDIVSGFIGLKYSL